MIPSIPSIPYMLLFYSMQTLPKMKRVVNFYGKPCMNDDKFDGSVICHILLELLGLH